MMMPTAPKKLSLEWVMLPDGRPALAFEPDTWTVFEETAQARGQSAQQMISTSVAAGLAPILVDNYAANRGR